MAGFAPPPRQASDLPDIGSSARELLEAEYLARGRTFLIEEESIVEALRLVRRSAREAGWSMRAGDELADHVEQCWITAVLR